MSKENTVEVSEQSYGYEQEDLTIAEGDHKTTGLQKPFDPKKINVTSAFVSMYNIVTRLKANRIDMAPDFQRNAGIWSRKAKTRLIESLLIRLPLPAFYFDTTDDNKWVVIDGLQRLTTVKEFVVENKWPLLAEDLEFLSDQCGNKYYKDLTIDLQGNLEESQVMICKILAGTPSRLKFDIFRRINTGGQPLNSQEIRHALNPGIINRFLKELVEFPEFKKASCNAFDSARMIDRECVLRFLAFYENDPQQYLNPDFDRFLNDYMEGFNKRCNQTTEEVEKGDKMDNVRNAFSQSMKLAVAIFGNDAFRKRYEEHDGRHPLNKALFEAWAVNLANVTPEEGEILIKRSKEVKSKFIELMKKPEFDSAITQGTASINRVRCRFKEIAKLIKEVIHA